VLLRFEFRALHLIKQVLYHLSLAQRLIFLNVIAKVFVNGLVGGRERERLRLVCLEKLFSLPRLEKNRMDMKLGSPELV
jgi:hypothetical protein